MLAQQYWNEIGAGKDFEDPLYLEKLSKFLTKESRIIEYGCGYGRMLNLLKSDGYKYLTGFDFAENMIARGRRENPGLDLRLLEDPGIIPFEDGSVDAVVMSTVLCSMVESDEKALLISEIRRVLKRRGVLYLTDFLLCDDPGLQEKYRQGMEQFGIFGMYQTSENLVVRHYRVSDILRLLAPFDIQWFEQFDFKTMNQNPARTFHLVAQKTDSLNSRP